MFNIMALRNVFVPKREEVPGEGKNLHNEEHRDLSLHQIVLE